MASRAQSALASTKKPRRAESSTFKINSVPFLVACRSLCCVAMFWFPIKKGAPA